MLVLVLPRMPTWVRMNSRTAIADAFSAALFQLGGLAVRRSRAVFFCSSAVGFGPGAARVSTEPAALPRCFVRLLRFVWAMAPTRVDDLRAVSGRGAARPRGTRPGRGAGRARRARRR